MSNIDKHALREAAEKALPAMQRLLMMSNDELFDEALLNVDGDVDAANAFNLLSGAETMLALLDELEALQSFRTAFNEWHDKTEWMQGDKRFDVIKPWGKHRADVLKLYIDHLESKLEAAEKTSAARLEAIDRTHKMFRREKDRADAAEKRIAETDLRNTELVAKIEPMDRQVDELTMWVKRLAHSLRKANSDNKLQSDAMDYLSRKGLISVEDVLR